MTDYATRLFNAVDTAQRMRLSDAVHAIPDGSLRSRGGLRDDGGGVPALVPSSLRFTLTEFIAEVPGAAAKQGAYPFIHDDGSTQYTILPGNALGARVDLAVARVRHDIHDSSGFTDAGIVVIGGVPGSGSAPAVPAGCIPIREFNVTASASAGSGGVTIGTDRRRLLNDDSGWLVPTMGAGWTPNSGNGYRRKNGNVTVNLNAGKANYASGEIIFTMLDGFRPDRTFYVAGQISGGVRFWQVGADGTVRAVGAGTVGILGSVTYPV